MTDEFWERAANQDPLWAILSDPTKRDRGWDLTTFFEHGRREIALLRQRLASWGASPEPVALWILGAAWGASRKRWRSPSKK